MTKFNFLGTVFAAIALLMIASLFAQPENLYIIGYNTFDDEPVDFTNGNTLAGVTLTLNQNTHTLRAEKAITDIAISSVEDLQKIGNDANYPVSGSYYLTADIDLSGIENWIPIGAASLTDGNPTHFTGMLDGRGYSIKNMKIVAATSNVKGLFGRLNHATVKDLNLVDVDISGQNVVGGVAGAMFGESTIQKVSVSGNITANTIVGGIVGRIAHNGAHPGYNFIEDCYVTANVTATSQSTDMNNPSCAGGIAAFSNPKTTDAGVECYGNIHIRRVYVTGAIISEQKSNVAGNAAGILPFSDKNKYVKIEEVLVLSSVIEAGTPHYFYCRRGDATQFPELMEKLYAREGISLVYYNDKGAGGTIPERL
jgi:hypothetical protein